MGLHVKLATYAAVVVNYQIVYSKGIELFTTCQTRRTSTNDSHLRFIYFNFTWKLCTDFGNLVDTGIDMVHLFDVINQCDADSFNLPINNHFACATLADTAIEAAIATINTMAVDWETGLMQGGGNGVALAPMHLLTVIDEFHYLALRDI